MRENTDGNKIFECIDANILVIVEEAKKMEGLWNEMKELAQTGEYNLKDLEEFCSKIERLSSGVYSLTCILEKLSWSLRKDLIYRR